MTLQRQTNLDKATEWLSRLSERFRASAAIRHQDANIEIEPFFRDFLNLLYGWDLQSSNFAIANQDSFDLHDNDARIAVQVTTTDSAKKIKKTLATFIPNHQSTFDRLLFVYPCLNKSTSKASFAKQLKGFSFNVLRDRLDLSDFLPVIQNLTIDKQNAVVQFLAKELQPLGVGLQLGVDENVEAICAIIKAMSAGIPDGTPETMPDPDKKLKRFQQHAEYLKRQYSSYANSYQTVKAARDAVGYDTVRAARCASWLRERSLAALDDNQNDAKLAFDTLVQQFVAIVHDDGTNCDQGVMRYFLADELFRCNVFPNPVEPTEP